VLVADGDQPAMIRKAASPAPPSLTIVCCGAYSRRRILDSSSAASDGDKPANSGSSLIELRGMARV
jgi:hypothetical protein